MYNGRAQFQCRTVAGRTGCYARVVDDRITPVPGGSLAQARIRNLDITVGDILGWIQSGLCEHQILGQHPELEKRDFLAIYSAMVEFNRG